ncbi:TNF receptor-associated factor 6-like [Amblyomma americanum]
MECPLCGILQESMSVAHHLRDQCPKRLLQCRSCGCDVAAAEKPVHEEECDQRPATCPHCEQAVSNLSVLENEHYPVCPLIPVNCSFQELGCTFKAPRNLMGDHESSSVHNVYLIAEICKLKSEKENLRSEFQEHLCGVEKRYEKRMADMEKSMDEMRKEMSSLRKENKKTGERFFKRLETIKRDQVRIFT